MSHTTSLSSSSIVLNISPRGYRSGLISFSRFGKSLRVLVLPKLWSGLDVWHRVHLSADTLTVIAYETERLALWFQDERTGEKWIQLIEECINQLHATAEEQTGFDTNEDELADLFTDSQIRKSLKSLITAERGRRPKASSAEWVKLSVIDEHSTKIKQTDTAQESLFTDHLDQLLRLVLCAQNLKAHERDYSYAEHGSGYLVYEGQNESDPLQLLMTHAFIKEMQSRHREVRQSYRLETANLNVIRGQITTRGIIQHAHLGIPSVECTYDEFTCQIPLFQVIVSALDHVSSGALFPRVYRALALVREVRTLAKSLRRELAHIPSLPLSIAAHQARYIRLKRSESSWQMALNMARLILTRSPLQFTDQTEGQGAVIWNVDTSKVWESVLKQLLDSMDSSSFLSDFKKEPALPPWVGLQKKEIDLVARTSSSMYILDAKYKEKCSPSAAEQYQVFAYSLLAEGLQDKIRCGLLYATRGDLTPLGETRKRSAGDDKEVDLIALAVPFPQRNALHNYESWQTWVRAQSSALGEALLVEEDRPNKLGRADLS